MPEFSTTTYQWSLMILISIILFFISPYAKTNDSFYKATGHSGKKPGVLLITFSIVISWIFAKSITNAANLGLEFGILGGIAYSMYYFSFLLAGIVIYQIRTKGKFYSFHHFLYSKYGKGAIIIFSLLVGFRLFNEVWSNTMVIGTYFGDKGSNAYYTSIILFTFLTLAYSLKGGLSSSLLTDFIQMLLFGFLLLLILYQIFPLESDHSINTIQKPENKAGGYNLLLVAFLQVFSYPFHDPVLTDRGFISSPKITKKSYIIASAIGVTCIILFSLIGVYAKNNGLQGQAVVEVSKIMGPGTMLAINLIMVTSASSTLDSTFSSFSKLIVIDSSGKKNISVFRGRAVMLFLAIAGTFPLFFNPEILSATTISGTMVIGLAPVFLFWWMKMPAISYYLAVVTGLITGILLSTGIYPESLVLFKGKYAALLSMNLYGTITAFLLFFLPKWIQHYV